MADGYGEFGGNGSVEWRVDVNDAEWVMDTAKGGNAKGRRQGGVDKYNGNGARSKNGALFFKVSIEQPAGRTPLKATVDEQGKIAIYVPIENNNPDQIRVSWAHKPDAAINGAPAMTVRDGTIEVERGKRTRS